MSAHAMIDQARVDGLELRINGDKIKLRGPASVVARWKPMLAEHKPEIMAALSAPRSTWWLIHYLDGAPVETWADPPATYDEILERHPAAIAAEPIHQSAPNRAKSCSTCKHITGRGSCGEPVAAGLSGLDGVIVYHGNGGADCPAWLATIPGDLEARILAMAERWQYSGDWRWHWLVRDLTRKVGAKCWKLTKTKEKNDANH